MLSDKEKKFAAYWLRKASDKFSYHGCNDVDQEEVNKEISFTEQEKQELAVEFAEWNGDPDFSPKFNWVTDFSWMRFLAIKLERDTDHWILVFGSNEKGIHGLGAAKTALDQWGAQLGRPEGLQGESYAIPTKDDKLQTLALPAIQVYVERFIQFAKENPLLRFKVTAIGTGLANIPSKHLAPMFADAPKNCYFDTVWKPWLSKKNFWGTFEPHTKLKMKRVIEED